ncbi:MAG: helix-turn-helix domain-containing protein [Clostridia bacterium]|nr:helix-turn-helix domain-containing protein [Clostridia bacterium]
MDCEKTGRLLLTLRQERAMTQKQLAEALGVSDKTVSKWERGLGCPDVSLLPLLALELGVSTDRLLGGDLRPQPAAAGNIRKTRFYLCPCCGNIATSSADTDISCCGRRLAPLEARPADAEHQPSLEQVEDEYYLRFPHEMSKEHYLSLCAYQSWDRMLLIKLYPEQEAALRLPRMSRGRLLIVCNCHGLLEYRLPPARGGK